jgi:hypothetical protein
MQQIDEILVEQIQFVQDKEFTKLKDYNTSILTNNESIYYYKRIYGLSRDDKKLPTEVNDLERS